MVFYQFDLKLYMETNGSYIDMEKELFGQRCTEEQELVEKLEEYIRDEFLKKKSMQLCEAPILPTATITTVRELMLILPEKDIDVRRRYFLMPV